MKSRYRPGYATAYNATLNITLEGHSGGYPGSFSFMYYCPQRDVYIAINVNTIDETSRTAREILFPILNALGSAQNPGFSFFDQIRKLKYNISVYGNTAEVTPNDV